MNVIAQPALTITPQALADFLAAAQADGRAPVAPRANIGSTTATAVALAGVAAAGACAALLPPTTSSTSGRYIAQWAAAAPAVWVGVHWAFPRWGDTVDALATLGVGAVVFTVVCLASRQVQGRRDLSGSHLACATVAAASIALLWRDAVLPNVPF